MVDSLFFLCPTTFLREFHVSVALLRWRGGEGVGVYGRLDRGNTWAVVRLHFPQSINSVQTALFDKRLRQYYSNIIVLYIHI